MFSKTQNSNLITYPRRWGKTTNMSMLECFTSIRRDPFGKEIINNSFEIEQLMCKRGLQILLEEKISLVPYEQRH